MGYGFEEPWRLWALRGCWRNVATIKWQTNGLFQKGVYVWVYLCFPFKVGWRISCGDNSAVVNFTERKFVQFVQVNEKAVGNFADHLKCNAVHGLVDPKLQGQFCQMAKKERASGATHHAGESLWPNSALKYLVKALSSTAANFLVPLELCNPVQQALHPSPVNQIQVDMTTNSAAYISGAIQFNRAQQLPPLFIIPPSPPFAVERFWAAAPFKCSTKRCTYDAEHF